MIKGKGYFIWQIRACSPDANKLVERAQQAGLQHVFIKIADGVNIYPSDNTSESMIDEAVTALTAAGIAVWGWSFVYGTPIDPIMQAQRFAARLAQFKLTGAVIDAENHPDGVWNAEDARTFMQTLKEELHQANMDGIPLAFSSYRFPSVHGSFPIKEFMEACTFAMPQVYWQGSTGDNAPVTQLNQSFNEYQPFLNGKPYIATGSAYDTGDWRATPSQVIAFMEAVKRLGFEAVNFWSWQHAAADDGLWDAISDFSFAAPIPTTPKCTTIIGTNNAGYHESATNSGDLNATTWNQMPLTWTHTTDAENIVSASWLPVVTDAGRYEIAVWIPGNHATTRNAVYHVSGVQGENNPIARSVDQSIYFDQYVRLGTFDLDPGLINCGMVTTHNLTGEQNKKLAFSSVRWRHLELPIDDFADGFDPPVGNDAWRRGELVWVTPSGAHGGFWMDTNSYLTRYDLPRRDGTLVKAIHTGADLFIRNEVELGQGVFAIADGKVIFSQEVLPPSTWGNLIIIEHKPFREICSGKTVVAYSRYAHLNERFVGVGGNNNTVVKRGTRIGTIGGAGIFAPHLHFDISITEILKNDPGNWPGDDPEGVKANYVDPLRFIRERRPLMP